MADKKHNIGVIGDGGWGTAVALLLLSNGHRVTMWGNFPDYIAEMNERRENARFLPGIPLPQELKITALQNDLEGSDVFVNAVPTQFVRPVFECFRRYCSGDKLVISLSKGIENGTLQRPSGIIRELIPDVPIAVLSGPSHGEEVARGFPTSVVAASEDANHAKQAQMFFANKRFRVYTASDVVGVELAAALKNVIAVAAGICDGLGIGDNAKAAIFSRGLVEMSRLGIAMGGERETFFGLAGVGDLFTTCTSVHSRNRAVGERIGRGEKLDAILSSMKMVAEGVATTRSVIELAERHKVEMPIATQAFDILFKNKSPMDGMKELMSRAPKPEFW